MTTPPKTVENLLIEAIRILYTCHRHTHADEEFSILPDRLLDQNSAVRVRRVYPFVPDHPFANGHALAGDIVSIFVPNAAEGDVAEPV